MHGSDRNLLGDLTVVLFSGKKDEYIYLPSLLSFFCRVAALVVVNFKQSEYHWGFASRATVLILRHAHPPNGAIFCGGLVYGAVLPYVAVACPLWPSSSRHLHLSYCYNGCSIKWWGGEDFSLYFSSQADGLYWRAPTGWFLHCCHNRAKYTPSNST